MNENLNDLIDKIHQMKSRVIFKKYIDYIRFPYFRNLETNTKINFNFPLTVFVGQNGSGKSSTLHALWGSSHKKTPYDFWFSTKVDPIQEVSEGGFRHCLIYAYTNNNGEQVEVIKIRIKKRNNPDYWETSRPIIEYEMKPLPEGKRTPPLYGQIVVYLDFRAELSAFDKYFYFRDPSRYLKSSRKQDYLRRKSSYLKNIIDEKKDFYSINNRKQNAQVNILSDDELYYISYILGKKYDAGKALYHKFFADWGLSIVFQTEHYKYTEAFAGSGEYAIVRLVHKIINAQNYSLVLLDEPEVSLHPGAQERLKLFLLNQIIEKKLQIVISTHSPTFIKGLPPEAIKVFYQQQNGKFHVDNERSPDEAFYFIGFPNPQKILIYVEDKLAKKIIESTIITFNDKAKENLFEVNIIPGGESSIKKHISTFSLSRNKNVYFYFDGDMRKEHFKISGLTEENRKIEFLKNIINTQTGCDFEKLGISINGKPEKINEDIEILMKYLDYYHSNVIYLPNSIPEELIWDDNVFDNEDIESKVKEFIKQEQNYKEKFKILAKELYGYDSNIENLVLQQKYIKKWIEKKDENYKEIIKELNKMISSTNA